MSRRLIVGPESHSRFSLRKATGTPGLLPFSADAPPNKPERAEVALLEGAVLVLASVLHSLPWNLLQPRPIKHADIGLWVAPGGPAVAGRQTNAPPRRTGVPAAGEPKIRPGVRFFFDHPVPCRKGCKTLTPLFWFKSARVLKGVFERVF